MIESRLDPALDGAGSGPSESIRTVAQIAADFRYLAADRQPRSVSAILRILREQSKGRTGQRELILGAIGFAAVAAFVWTLALLFSPDRRLGFFGNVPLGLAVLLGIPAALDAKRLRRDDAQLDEIRRLALETLGMIVASPWFVPEPLDKEERRSFRTLRRLNPETWTRVATILIGEGE